MLRGTALVTGGVFLGGAADLGTARGAFAAGEPTVYHRGDWGARSAKRTAQVLSSGPDHIVIHHTATANSTDYSRDHAFALSRSIQRYHMDTNGWDDIGQQLTISRGGHIMEGRNSSLPAIRNRRHAVGAHTANHNAHTIGIENEGTYTSATPPAALMDALVETCAWLCAVYGLKPDSAIVGHRDYNVTSCPGDKLYALLPQLRRDVSAALARIEMRLAAPAPQPVPEEHLPSFPEVPMNERAVAFAHGPALGPADPTR